MPYKIKYAYDLCRDVISSLMKVLKSLNPIVCCFCIELIVRIKGFCTDCISKRVNIVLVLTKCTVMNGTKYKITNVKINMENLGMLYVHFKE